MSYTKQIWNSADIITADKLNHIEAGVATISRIKVLTPTYSSSGDGYSEWYVGITISELEELINNGYFVYFYFKTSDSSDYQEFSLFRLDYVDFLSSYAQFTTSGFSLTLDDDGNGLYFHWYD